MGYKKKKIYIKFETFNKQERRPNFYFSYIFFVFVLSKTKRAYTSCEVFTAVATWFIL